MSWISNLWSLERVTDLDGLAYHIVDVFTERAFAGNPLAVVLGAERLAAAQMQAIANEFQLSETAFPLLPDASQEAADAGADYLLRIFTPDTELPFAGHPSIGTAWVLQQLGWFGAGNVVRDVMQLCGEGLLSVTVDADGATLAGGPPRVGQPIDPLPALAAVGLGEKDLSGEAVRVASTGLAYAIVPVSADALGRSEPDIVRLRRDFSYPSDATGVYVVSWVESVRHVRARMFAGDIGSPEDAATGSAALALGAYLGACGLLTAGTSHIEVVQGVEMGRPSLLHVACDISGDEQTVRVAGKVARVATGHIAIPAIPPEAHDASNS